MPLAATQCKSSKTQYPDHLLRTLQRRVRIWRSQIILAFDDALLLEEALLNQPLPLPLRTIPLPIPADAAFVAQ